MAVSHITLLNGLPIVRKLLDRFHQRGIEYCHWKSNQHVLQGMVGETDLDILVAKDSSQTMIESLCQAGYKRLRPVASSSYPAVEDYLAMDQSTGKLVHIHLYHQLIVGESHLKGYRLPWETLVLSNRIFLPQNGIFTSCPEAEMILLIVRAALKLRFRNRILRRLGCPYLGSAMISEFLWLRERIEINRLQEHATQLLGRECTASLLNILQENSLTYQGIRTFKTFAMVILRNYRSHGVVFGNFRRWQREATWASNLINKKFLHLPIPLRRIPEEGGLVVALLGCDGAGKSTQVKRIVKWLSWKIDVLPIYFGSGNGPSSVYRWPLKLLSHLIKYCDWTTSFSAQKSNVTYNSARKIISWYKWYKRIGRVPWALLLAFEKKAKIRALTRARNRGMVVICDRYPQNQIHGFNDGPLLGNLAESKSRLMRHLAEWEVSCYSLTKLVAPDIVLKLQMNPEVAFSRNPDMSLTELKRRVDAIRLLQFNSPTKVVNIDATNPLEQVTLEIKRNIWENI